MIRIAIHVEGFTEQEFVKNIISDYLWEFGIEATPIIVTTSKDGSGKKHKGGLTNNSYQAKIRIELRHLLYSFDYVTTMYDYYGIPHDFPGYDPAETGTEIQISNICKALSTDINNIRFIPFLIKHEFETLLYVQPQAADIIDSKFSEGMKKVLSDFQNLPENINNNRATSPSHRIKALYPNYDKVFHGNIIALEIGIMKMLDMCLHFANWIDKLSSLGNKAHDKYTCIRLFS
jgi:hypothetical protein